jgi:hypothetical protein
MPGGEYTVHEKIVPGYDDPIDMVVFTLLQIDCIMGVAVTSGTGSMVTVKDIGAPIQPCAEVGVAVIVPVMPELVPFGGAVQDEIFPVPPADKPIVVFVFVQLMVLPDGTLTKFPIFICCPGHTEILLTCVTAGVGYIATVKFIGLP